MINGKILMIVGGYYLSFLTIVGILSMGIDKQKARHNRWRVPEKTLFLIAILGGSIGSLCGIYLFRHKTKHKSFVYGIPFILCLQIGIGLYMIQLLYK